jgi:hypothetical protein
MGDFQKLIVWQKSKDLAIEIYKITNDGKFNFDFRLRDQMRASAISIASNIAEGDELKTQIIISNEIGYISKDDTDTIIFLCDEIGKMLNKLIAIRKAKLNT